eukprot:g67808.t1
MIADLKRSIKYEKELGPQNTLSMDDASGTRQLDAVYPEQAVEEQEDTKALVEEATSTVSGLTYSCVEVLPDIIAEAPHKGVKDRELDNEHVLELMKKFYSSQNQNDKIEWVGWMCDKSDKVGYTEDLGLGERDDELLVPSPFCKKEVVQEFVDNGRPLV